MSFVPTRPTKTYQESDEAPEEPGSQARWPVRSSMFLSRMQGGPPKLLVVLGFLMLLVAVVLIGLP